MRLIGYFNALLVFFNGQWHPVCQQYSTMRTTANTVCHQLGFNSSSSGWTYILPEGLDHPGNLSQAIRRIECDADAPQLSLCTITMYSYPQSMCFSYFTVHCKMSSSSVSKGDLYLTKQTPGPSQLTASSKHGKWRVSNHTLLSFSHLDSSLSSVLHATCSSDMLGI